MDISLKSEAEKLTESIKRLIKEEEDSYIIYANRVAELTNELQTNPDLQNDRSENNSFVVTKENRDIAQAMVNTISARIESLRGELTAYKPTGYITLGTTVELRLLSIDGMPPSYETKSFIIKIVNHATGKASAGLIANDSPIGLAVLGKKAGDEIVAIAPGGRVRYKIERMY